MLAYTLGMNMDENTAKEFWKLQAKVDGHDSKFNTLIEKIDRMSDKVESLSLMAERGKGAYWAALTLASTVSGFLAWFASTFLHKPGP
jgi:hypothetical protein